MYDSKTESWFVINKNHKFKRKSLLDKNPSLQMSRCVQCLHMKRKSFNEDKIYFRGTDIRTIERRSLH